jgi:hypothetical protein
MPLRLLLAAEILAAYAEVRWQLSRRDIRDLAPGVQAQRQRLQPDSAETSRVAGRLADAVRRTLRFAPTHASCLHQSLALSKLLSARGISSTLVIGARMQTGFAAHAWVEHQGRAVLPVLGFDDSRLLEI